MIRKIRLFLGALLVFATIGGGVLLLVGTCQKEEAVHQEQAREEEQKKTDEAQAKKEALCDANFEVYLSAEAKGVQKAALLRTEIECSFTDLESLYHGESIAMKPPKSRASQKQLQILGLMAQKAVGYYSLLGVRNRMLDAGDREAARSLWPAILNQAEGSLDFRDLYDMAEGEPDVRREILQKIVVTPYVGTNDLIWVIDHSNDGQLTRKALTLLLGNSNVRSDEIIFAIRVAEKGRMSDLLVVGLMLLPLTAVESDGYNIAKKYGDEKLIREVLEGQIGNARTAQELVVLGSRAEKLGDQDMVYKIYELAVDEAQWRQSR